MSGWRSHPAPGAHETQAACDYGPERKKAA